MGDITTSLSLSLLLSLNNNLEGLRFVETEKNEIVWSFFGRENIKRRHTVLTQEE
jgi:hypothetical protein